MKEPKTPEEAVYKFAVDKKERFIGMQKAHQYYPNVKDQLIKDFWKLVFEKLESKKTNKDWNVRKDDYLNHNNSKIYLTHHKFEELENNQLPPFSIGFEGLLTNKNYCGLIINRDGEKYNYEEIFEKCSNLVNEVDHLHSWKEPSQGWWPIWKSIERLDTEIDNNLYSMLPDVRDPLAEEIVDDIIKLQEDIGDKVVEIFRNSKKS